MKAQSTCEIASSEALATYQLTIAKVISLAVTPSDDGHEKLLVDGHETARWRT